MNKKKRKKKGIWIALAVFVILAAAAGIVWLLIRSGKIPAFGRFSGNNAGKENAVSSSIQTETAKRGSIRVTAQGSGAVEPVSSHAVTLEYDGVLEEISIEPGDMVSKGDILAVYDIESIDDAVDAKKEELDSTDEAIAQMSRSGADTVKSPVAGRVKRIFAHEGDVTARITEEKGGLLELSADGRMKTEVSTDRGDITEGTVVTVDFDDHTVDGVVWKAEDSASGKRILTVTWPDDTAYRVDKTAVVKDQHDGMIGEGITASAHPYLVRATIGVIDSVEVSLDSNVEQGDTLFTRRAAPYSQPYLDLLERREEILKDMEDLSLYRSNPVVTAPMEGCIMTLDTLEGTVCHKDQQLCSIADTGSMNLKIDIDELDIDGVKTGQSVEVTFDAFEDEVYTGEVSKISGIGENIGGVTTYAVTIHLDDTGRIRDAMSATATITLEEKADVLLIPADAAAGSEGAYFAEVVRDGVPEKREITIGLVNEDYAEVTDGLTEGEAVVVNTKDSEDLFQQMMERRSQMMQERESN